MAKTNSSSKRAPIFTYEGARAAHANPVQQLRRLTMAHMLWEDQFYVDGKSSAELLAQAVKDCKPADVLEIAIEAREKQHLRHVPLFLVREVARDSSKLKDKGLVAETLGRVIQRADELAEFLSIYWKDKRQPLSAQVKKGLAMAFTKFGAYQLAKYNRDNAVKLRDVLFLCHAKPRDKEQAGVWAKLVEGTLEPPDTWEVALSAISKDNKASRREVWTRLLAGEKLGGLAFLRNLRNMREDEMSDAYIAGAFEQVNFNRVLPFRFVAAAIHNPTLEPAIEVAMLRACESLPRLAGKTALVVDNSGSMYHAKISAKSELERIDAACALAIMAREVCEDIVVLSYSTKPSIVPARRGFALRDAIKAACTPNSTNTQDAIFAAAEQGYDRIIVITDEQSHQRISNPLVATSAYIINVAAYRNGIGYGQGFVTVDGWSENTLAFIGQLEEGESGSGE